MGSFVFWLLRPVVKALLWAVALYALAVLPALVYTYVRPGSETTQRPLLYAMVAAWNVLLLGGFLTLRVRRSGGGGRRWRRRVQTPSGAHGTAAWGDGRALLTPTTGRLVGRQGGRLLRYDGDGHLLTIAPTRSGKGVSAVIPNLLTHPGSVVVTDLKGENYAVTAARRAVDLGHTVHALDPFDVVGGTATFNPLDLVDPLGLDAADDAAMIAEMLVVSDTGGRGTGDRFWDDEARAWLAGLALYVAARPDPTERNLPYLRELLTGTPSEMAALLDAMKASGGLVRRAAARLEQKADRERSGVISSAQSHTHFLDSPRMARVLGSSSLDLHALKAGRLSVYLVLPPARLDAYRRWLRVMIACALRAVTGTPGQPRERVLFLLDEFANLGPMAPVTQAVSLLAGYGASLWLFVQDLAQLRAVYPDAWGSYLANADVLQAFGTADQSTAELLSTMTGQATVSVESLNRSAGRSTGDLKPLGQSQHGSGATLAEAGRPLLFPDEVRRLRPDQQLLFIKGAAPLLADRLSYLGDTEFVGWYSANPMHHPAP